MRKFLASAALILFALISRAQTTSVTATVVDSDTTTWTHATWKLSFLTGPSDSNPTHYKVGSSALSPSVQYQSGVSNGSGVISFTAYQSTLVTPAGSGWSLSVCPNASVGCTTIKFNTTSSTLDLSSAINAVITPPRFSGVSGSYGYADVEVKPAKAGSTYWNTTSGTQRCYNNVTPAWGACGSGGGGGIGGTVSSPNVSYASGPDTLSDSALQYDPTGVSTWCSAEGFTLCFFDTDGTNGIGFSPAGLYEQDGSGDIGVIVPGAVEVADYLGNSVNLASSGVEIVGSNTSQVLLSASGSMGVDAGTTHAYVNCDITGSCTLGGATSGQAAIGTDGTNGYLEVNENGAGLARVCTASNNACFTAPFIGSATAPTGSCTTGAWQFTQDGNASFCKAGTWEVAFTAP